MNPETFGIGPTAAIVGGACFAALIVIVAVQLFASARTAGNHLASAAALATQTRDSATEHTDDSAAHSRLSEQFGGRFAAANRALDSGESDEAASAQISEQLGHYYAANISQGNAIFWASMLAMVIGFAIIFIGIVSAGAHTATAIVAAIAGILSQFIGATFLVALRTTQAQSTTYAQTLVQLRLRDLRAATDARSVALGLQLLGEISGDGADALSNQTRAALAMSLVSGLAPTTQAPAPAPAPPAPMVSVDGDEVNRGGLRVERRRAPSVTSASGRRASDAPAPLPES